MGTLACEDPVEAVDAVDAVETSDKLVDADTRRDEVPEFVSQLSASAVPPPIAPMSACQL